MKKMDGLKDIIANHFASEYKAYDLKDVCKNYGIKPDERLNPMDSKRIYVANGLNKLQDEDIWKLAGQIVKEFKSKELIKDLEPYLGDTELEFSFVTRRRIIDYANLSRNMEGNMKLDNFLSCI